jgi:hypothetical protein
MTVMAVMGFGPRASAAYVSMADTTSPGGVCCTSSDSPATPARTLDQNHKHDEFLLAHLSGGGGMAPTGTGSSSGSPSVVGHLSSVELPVSGLVVYFREPAASFDLSRFIDSILDPPRQA